jgi:chemotaxis protein MotB
MVLVLATDVLFTSGSAQLSKEGRAAVQEVAAVLAQVPDRSFQVEGHTDNVPIATAQYPSNWELASARAINVTRAMVDAGMVAGRISAASFGDGQPARPNDSPEGRSANRRIEIVVVPDLSSLPGVQELQRAAEGS